MSLIKSFIADIDNDVSVDFEISNPVNILMAPSSGTFSFVADTGSIIAAGNYTADENKPDSIDGYPNPNKNILVDNQVRTIQANVLTAAQAAALLS